MSYVIGIVAEIVLWADDIEAMVKFYRDVLGFEQLSPPQQKSPIHLQGCVILLDHVPVPQVIVLQQKPDDGTASQHYPRQQLAFALQHNTSHKQLHEFITNGVVIRDSKPHPEYMGQTFIVDDPMGNEVKFVGLSGPLVVDTTQGAASIAPFRANPS